MVAFSINMSRACSGMLSSENDDFKFVKNYEKHKMHVHHVHHSSRARVTILSPQTSLSLTRKMNRAVLYIFRNIEISILVTFH